MRSLTGACRRTAAALVAAMVVAAAGACAPARPLPAPDVPAALSRADARSRAASLVALGAALFVDRSLSASGRLSCASCHDPAHAFGPANDLAVQLGGRDLRQPGIRAVPSLMYLQGAPLFTEHYFDSEDEADSSVDNGPAGGLTWDGRVDRGRDQARIPLLSPFEMASPSPAAIARAVRRGASTDAVRRLLSPTAFADDAVVFDVVLEALEAYQQRPEIFAPYRSRYDDYLAGRGVLTAQEQRGLTLFNDETKGNCARCHLSAPALNGLPPQFTDYGLIAIGLPRNPAIPANADPQFIDLGLCGPERTDFRDRADYCGRFRTPTLRNAALRRTFFHNGVVHTLEDAIRFYVERDTHPERWYPLGPSGMPRLFDDLPARFRANLDVEAPFGDARGAAPRLSSAEIADIASFIATLTDRR